MQYIEYQRDLPENLIIPRMRTKATLDQQWEEAFPDYSDRGCYFGRLSSLGYIWLDGPNASQTIEKPQDLFSVLEKHRHTFVIMPLNYISILWRGFSETFKERIVKDPNLWMSEDSWWVMRPSPRKYLFRHGNRWHTLWILQVKPVSGNPDLLVDTYMKLEHLGLTPNPAGISSTGRDFLFGPSGPDSYNRIREEFLYISRINPKTLENIYNACKRPAMVCSTLGHIPPAYNEDMRKAFLLGLIHAPTMSPYNTIVDEVPNYNPEASHAVYLIDIVIPPQWKFAPNLLRLEDYYGDYGVFCPTGGPQIQLVGQLRARLYKELSIPYKVIRAWKLLPIQGPTYPWILRGGYLSLIVDQLKDNHSPIEGSLLYQAAIGSLLTLYEYHDKGGKDHSTTLNVFNLLLELFIYEWVFVNNWLKMIRHPSQFQLALRIDACSFLNYKDYKPEETPFYKLDKPYPTEMFFANPRQKDKDIKEKSVYKDAVEEAAKLGERDVYIKTTTVGTLELLQEGIITPEQYGKRVTLKQKLNLHGETRIPINNKYKDLIAPSDLVDNSIELMDPHLE